MTENDEIRLRDVPDQQNSGPDPDPFAANGVSFDGLHSYTDFGLWLVARPDTGSPKPKLNRVEVPGMDGIIDMTEVNAGEVKFSNRTMVFQFAGMVNISEQTAFKTKIINALHGKRIEKIILDEDSMWYYTGRVTVQFPKSNSWKVYCTITVDAEPYAQNIFMYALSLDPLDYEVETEVITIAENSSKIRFMSVFALGTKVFPDGLDAQFGSILKIGWNDTPLDLTTVKHICVYDSDGGICAHDFTPSESARVEYLTFTEIEQAGVDLAKVYQIEVIGIGNCTLSAEANLAHIPVENKRKTVVPSFTLAANAPVSIMVNGVSKEVPIGATQSAEIVLRSGMNDIYVADNPLANIRLFMMYYREGKL